MSSIYRTPESSDYPDTLADCKVWQDKAAVNKPDFTGTLAECKKFARSNPLLDDLFIDLPDGEQMAWNEHTYEWDML